MCLRVLLEKQGPCDGLRMRIWAINAEEWVNALNPQYPASFPQMLSVLGRFQMDDSPQTAHRQNTSRQRQQLL